MIYAKLAAALAILLVIAGACWKIYQAGGDAVRVEYAARDLKAAADYASKTKEIEDSYRAKEGQWASQSAAVSKKYQRELANHETTKLAALAAVDAGTLKLRLTDAPACAPSGSSTAAPSTTARGRDGDAKGQFLGKADSAFLIAEASRADSVVIQLQACQQVLVQERK